MPDQQVQQPDPRSAQLGHRVDHLAGHEVEAAGRGFELDFVLCPHWRDHGNATYIGSGMDSGQVSPAVAARTRHRGTGALPDRTEKRSMDPPLRERLGWRTSDSGGHRRLRPAGRPWRAPRSVLGPGGGRWRASRSPLPHSPDLDESGPGRLRRAAPRRWRPLAFVGVRRAAALGLPRGCAGALRARHGGDPLLGRGLPLRPAALPLADDLRLLLLLLRAALAHAALIGGAVRAAQLADRDPGYAPVGGVARHDRDARGDAGCSWRSSATA